MTQIVPLDEVTPSQKGGVVSIGNFDGVHRGHGKLLKSVRRIADRLGGPALAVVLDPHPAEILRPDKAPAKLTSIDRRAQLMDQYGIDALVVCSTTPDFLAMSAETFFGDLVVARLEVKAMVEGPNFFFGKGRAGNIDVLNQLCAERGVELEIVAPAVAGNEMISSTRIRGLLETSKIESANELLGVRHRISGRVIEGDQRGREIGFPTANLAEIRGLVPCPGVYGGLASVDGQSVAAAIHIGPIPTFDDGLRNRVEVHLLDYSGDLYGKVLEVDFATHVRDIARFDSAEALVNQLQKDIGVIRSQLQSISTP